MKKLLLGLLLIPMLASAQVTKVKDIFSGAGEESSSPRSFTALGDQVVFTAANVLGYELWISDGTVEGTRMLKDITPGVESTFSSSTTDFVEFDGKLFFSADDGIHGEELWQTDGTEEGTYMVADSYEGENDFSPEVFYVWNNELYFQGTNEVGTELWQYNGTDAPSLVADISDGMYNSNQRSSKPENFTAMGDKLYFTANTSTTTSNAPELFVYDGVNAPEMVADINTGSYNDVPFGSSPKYLTVVENVLYFQASDGSYSENHGAELWKYDGTNAPEMVKDFKVGSSGSSPANLVGIDTLLFFVADAADTIGKELWFYDTRNDSVHLLDIYPGYTTNTYGYKYSKSSSPNYLTVFDSVLYFAANDGSHGIEVYSFSPATDTMPVLLGDLRPGTSAGFSSSPDNFYKLDDLIYFMGNDGSGSSAELWKMDTSPEDTTTFTIVKDILPAYGSYNDLTLIGDKFWFGVDDKSGLGNEPWISDGSEEGTHMFTDINAISNSEVNNFTVFNDLLYFTATNGVDGNELWVTDGSESGTQMVVDVDTSGDSSPFYLTAINDKLFFVANNDKSTGKEFYTYDGADTALIMDLNPGTSDGVYKTGDNYTPVAFMDKLLYVGYPNYSVNNELIWTDGTMEGTDTITNAESTYGYPMHLTVVGDTVFWIEYYFNASMNIYQMLYFDGETVDTFPSIFTDIYSAFPSTVYGDMITKYKGDYYFQAKTQLDNVGYELYKFTPETDTAVLVADIYKGNAYKSGSPSYITEVNGKLVFAATDGTSGYELYVCDGDTATMLVDIDTNDYQGGLGAGTYNLSGFTRFNDTALFFTADNGSAGTELWITNGTANGTYMVKDINEGEGSSVFSNIVTLDGEAYFIANDRLWRSDATAEGTYAIADQPDGFLLNKNPSTNNENVLTAYNGEVYLSGYNGYGEELYKYTPVALPKTQSSIALTAKTDTSADLSLTVGEGASRVLFIAEGSDKITSLPANATAYIASADLSAKADSLDSFYCVYNGTGTSVSVSGLMPATDYVAYVFDYNGSDAAELYVTDTTANYVFFTTKDVQTITFDALTEVTYGDTDFDLTATASSGLDVTYTSSDETVASVNGATVTLVGAGEATITASQAGDDNYVSAEDVTQSLTVNKADQTITFEAIASAKTTDNAFELVATASSGLEVSFTSRDESVATISGSTISYVGAGVTTITASQEGNENYNAAEDVVQDLEVAETLAINEEMANGIKMYPSPATSVVTLNLGDSFRADNQVSIMGVNGQVVTALTLQSAEETISVEHLNTGMYFVKIQLENQLIIKKLIIE